MNRQSPPSARPGDIGRRLAQNSRKTINLFVRRRRKPKIYARFHACTESAPLELGHSLRQPTLFAV
jgi:hypothetical protein